MKKIITILATTALFGCNTPTGALLNKNFSSPVEVRFGSVEGDDSFSLTCERAADPNVTQQNARAAKQYYDAAIASGTAADAALAADMAAQFGCTPIG